MSNFVHRFSESELVARLRAAGCVFAEDEALLLMFAAATDAELGIMLESRVAGLPLEHVLGWAEFCGRRIYVETGVFVPRRRTEFLIQQAIALAAPKAVVVDLCCGSGALGAAVAAKLPDIELHAADIEPTAVLCAQRNLADIGGRTYVGDLFDPLPPALQAHVDVLLANVPYVPTEEIELLPPEARVHEPRVALDGGVDGLAVLRRVSVAAAQWLARDGHLLVETSERQAPTTAEIFAHDGLIPRVINSDDYYATVVVGQRDSKCRS